MFLWVNPSPSAFLPVLPVPLREPFLTAPAGFGSLTKAIWPSERQALSPFFFSIFLSFSFPLPPGIGNRLRSFFLIQASSRMGTTAVQKAGPHYRTLAESGTDAVYRFIPFFPLILFFLVKQIILPVFLIGDSRSGNTDQAERLSVPQFIKKPAGRYIDFLRNIRGAA